MNWVQEITPRLLWLIQLMFFALLLGLEWLIPFRRRVQSRTQRVSTNLILFATGTLLTGFVAAQAAVTRGDYLDRQSGGLLHRMALNPVAKIGLAVILFDGCLYAFHWLNHRVPFLWRFHRIHHSDLDLDMTTSVRFHFGEVLLTMVFRMAVALAIRISLTGFLACEALFLLAAQFQHSNIRLPDWAERFLQLVVVTPSMHRIHHSRRPSEHHRNFGVLISCWDRWLGTYKMGLNTPGIQPGLDAYPEPEDVEILRLIRMPLDRP